MDPNAANDALSLIPRVGALGKRASHVQFDEALMAARQEILKYKEENLTSWETAFVEKMNRNLPLLKAELAYSILMILKDRTIVKAALAQRSGLCH
ncbi:hypothetical protein H7097_02360 [Aeromicrobium sp.]|nr:hypothetical protein [Candidatus Saccharibacteria bacterium]